MSLMELIAFLVMKSEVLTVWKVVELVFKHQVNVLHVSHHSVLILELDTQLINVSRLTAFKENTTILPTHAVNAYLDSYFSQTVNATQLARTQPTLKTMTTRFVESNAQPVNIQTLITSINVFNAQLLTSLSLIDALNAPIQVSSESQLLFAKTVLMQ